MNAATARAARALLVPAALMGLCASSLAQDFNFTMSLEEASYRAGKARIMARYQEDLATCKGLGNAQARGACTAAAAINRDNNRRALKGNLGPTSLGRYLASLPAEQQPVPHTAKAVPIAAVAQRAVAAKPTPAAAPAVQLVAASTVATGDSGAVGDGYALALKTSYGGN